MHLKKIKLAGFKSFVDPTAIVFKSNGTVVVGPNGCGKSNIIDAVRWVTGESSAKQLRGKSMEDVIFNGTSNRKPVGQAAVELFFDNVSATLTGEYAKYDEIAIRREINRDGMSNYYLNGARCRRKDIIDIFLGTGLGPRSYAIIEQGIVSQLIEAKPDELRVYFEEAAGISKYKERRRETEARIRHTRDNLERLNDIRVELESQLRHLKRQANAANRYKNLKQEQRSLKAQQQALHWRAVHDQVNEHENNIKQCELKLEAKLAAASKAGAEIEKLRQQQIAAGDELSKVQGDYYRLGADISRIEQQIQHNKERCTELGQNLLDIDKSWQELQQHIINDKDNITKLETSLAALEKHIIIAVEVAEKARTELTEAEQAMHKWQTCWDNFNEQAAQSSKQVEVAKTKVTYLEQQIANDTDKLQQLQQEQAELPNFAVAADEIIALETKTSSVKNKMELLTGELKINQEKITSQRQHGDDLVIELDKNKNELQKLHGKHASLEILQQTALGKTNLELNSWLTDNDLANKPRLAEGLQVEPGWEVAVETVLKTYLEAVCVDDIAKISTKLEQLASGNVAFFDVSQKPELAPDNALAHKVKSTLPITNLLAHICVAENLQQAAQLRASLKPYESVITKKGIWLGSSWVKANFAKDANGGMLQRECELRELTKQIQIEQKTIAQQEQKLQQSKISLAELENQREQLQQQANEINAAHGDVYGNLAAKKTNLQYLQNHTTTLQQEIVALQQRHDEAKTQLLALRDTQQQAAQDIVTIENQRAELLSQRDQYRNDLQAKRDKYNQVKYEADELKTRIEVNKNQLQYLQQGLARAKSQISSLKERKDNIASSMQNTETPLTGLDKELQQALEKRLTAEEELSIAKQKQDNSEHALREAEKHKVNIQKEEQAFRDQLEQTRMEWQALQVRCTTYDEQIADMGFELNAVLRELSEAAEFNTWEEKTAKITNKIEKLGPINLAAIAEYDQKSERKNYLDAQNGDLTEALQTLEDAIRKIDRESRERFKKTFDSVNNEFSRLFPIVFNGGKAMLELTEHDLLNTGINIVAQPPGKRNSSIHLLSGGEKALTAIALVFAIFQLNPAPFCMLDEVDAPLDDNNIIRFTNLVKEMSSTVQFIVVTHNKTTMEMAHQLLGVTMQEPGVSRMVSVDIQEAISFAGN